MREYTSHEHTSNHAMTEIALALSMAFFCLMVLSLVAAGVPEARPTPSLIQLNQNRLQQVETQGANGTWVIYFEERYFDVSLQPLDPGSLNQDSVYLAVDPKLGLQQLLSAQSRISSPDVSITLLDEAWISRLEELP
ncbi:MAG: hypothetical protein CMK89_14670 [Pseudomonadales bacterium]|nr:hypothetical protein [Pseudomonadales bacterium]